MKTKTNNKDLGIRRENSNNKKEICEKGKISNKLGTYRTRERKQKQTTNLNE